jgi:hypothetical protein
MNFHQTTEHARYLQSIGWIVETHIHGSTLVRAYIKRLPLIPISLMKLQRMTTDSIDWKWVRSLQQKYHVYETDIELDQYSDTPPQEDEALIAHGYHPVTDYMLTTKTRVVDLSQTETALLQAFKPKTRYNLHLAEKHGLVSTIYSATTCLTQSDLFDRYYDLLALNARRIGMLLLPKSWIRAQLEGFGDHAFIVVVTQPDSDAWLAASLFFTSSTTCSYSHNGSTALGRTLMAPTLAIMAGMQEGKRRGLVEFDFDGVYDERYPKQQRRFMGFGRFKAGFGGQEVYFPPMYKQMRWPI